MIELPRNIQLPSISKQDFYLCGIILDVVCLLLIFSSGIKPNSSFVSPLAPFFSQFGARDQTLTNGQVVAMPNLYDLSTKGMQYQGYITQRAKQFMKLPPASLDRAKQEVGLMVYLRKHNASAADILFAIQAVASRPARAYGVEYLWTLRQKGSLAEFKIYPLEAQKIQWAKDRNIDPRMLAVATDLYGPVLKLMSADPNTFFEAAKETKAKESDLSQYIPNPAVVAKLQMSETGWTFASLEDDMKELGFEWDFPADNIDFAFVNIGGVSAWDALNLSEEWFPSGHSDLVWISEKLEKSSGLPYVSNVKLLPGSARGWGDGSGGAIGPQFMPLNARLFMTWYARANQKLGNEYPEMNPFNPWMGTMLSYLYLSSEFYHRQLNVNNVTDVVRPGYEVLSTDTSHLAYQRSDPRIKALLKWNPLYWEAKGAVEAGEEYSDIWYVRNTLTFR